MTNKTLNRDKAESVFLTVKSAESSDSIPDGTPVALVMNGTNDGLAVVLPATATATKVPRFAYGVAMGAIGAGLVGKVQVFGFCRRSVIVNRTRAASTDAWASRPGLSVSQALTIQTANNAFNTAAIPSSYVTGSATSDTLALDLNAFLPYAILAESLASTTTGPASTTSNALLVSTSLAKTFIRML